MRSRQGQWQRHATRLGVALSLLLHSGALLLYLALAEPPATLPRQRPFLVELVRPGDISPPAINSTGATGDEDRQASRHGSATAAPAVSALPDSPTPLPSTALSPPPSSPPALALSPRPPPAPPSPPSPSLPPALAAPGPPEVAPPSPRAWFEANDLGPAPATGPNVPADLTARGSAALVLAGGGAGEGSGQDTTTARRVGTLLRQASGKARVRSSHDPAWSPLSEKLRAHFQPDWSLLEQGPQPRGIAATGLARTIPGYLRMAERFARSERLSDADGVMGERTSEAGKVIDRIAAAGGQSSTGLGPPPERLENPFQRTWVTLVEVAHRDDGSVADIRLRQPCGNGAIDRLALSATRRAVAESDPAAWAEKARTSVWAFTVVFGVVPPAPVLGCPTDVVWTGRFDRCAYPLKKLSVGQVELEGIE